MCIHVILQSLYWSFDIGSIIIKASIELSCDGVLAQFLVLSTF